MPSRAKAAGKKGGNAPLPPYLKRALLGLSNEEALILMSEILAKQDLKAKDVKITTDIPEGSEAVTTASVRGGVPLDPALYSEIKISPEALKGQPTSQAAAAYGLPARYQEDVRLPSPNAPGGYVSPQSNILYHEAGHLQDVQDQFEAGKLREGDFHDPVWRQIAENMGMAVGGPDPETARAPRIIEKERVTRGQRKKRAADIKRLRGE